jgi:regulation of enolase protein 1 (concanavalin A-like superfamily)
MLRLAYFPPNVKAQIGVVAAAPGKKSFPVVFENFEVKPVEKK